MYIERYGIKSQIRVDGFSKPGRFDKKNIPDELWFIIGTQFHVSSDKNKSFPNNIECVSIVLILQNAIGCFVKHISRYH